jgi:hypothetical protein
VSEERVYALERQKAAVVRSLDAAHAEKSRLIESLARLEHDRNSLLDRNRDLERVLEGIEELVAGVLRARVG